MTLYLSNESVLQKTNFMISAVCNKVLMADCSRNILGYGSFHAK